MTAQDDDLRRRALEALFAESPDAMYILDVDGRFVAGNQALVKRTGVPWGRLQQTEFDATVHPDDRERVRAEFLAAARGGTRRYSARGVRPDGSTFHADTLNAPITRDDGSIGGVVGIAHDIDELTGVRSSLDRSEALVRMATRLTRIGGWAVDLDTYERHWSHEVRDLLGFPQTSLPIQTDVLGRLDGDDERARYLEAWNACVSDGAPIDVTVAFRLPDDSLIDIRIVGEAVRDGGGRIVRVQGAVADITEELRVRRERGLLEARLRTAFDGIGDAIVFVDADWRLTFLNSRAVELLGRGSPELIGTLLWDLDLPDPEGEEMLREVMHTRRSLVRRRFDEVLQRWMEVTGFAAGDLLGIQVRDVTEVEEARRRIVDDSRLLHAQSMLLDSATDAIIMRGLGDVIENANRSTTQLLGVPIDELIGSQLADALGLDDDLAREIEAGLGRLGSWEGDLVVHRPDGSARTTEARWQVVHDLDGNPDAVFCVLIDVTERRAQDEIVMRTQRMESIGTLASGIAHDLNNVLTPLLLATQILAHGEHDEKRLRLLAGMQQTVERGGDMIRQVLTFARGVEGERTVVDIAELARRFAEFCRDILPKDIVVDVTTAEGLAVVGDATQLLQVLMNLATNARDAMPSGGRLTLTAAGAAERVVIEVADDGVGMPADTLARIFEPFYTTKGLGRGTGLGLSVSQAIARTHGGSLEATSEPGGGTRFRLDLPRTTLPAKPEMDVTTPADPGLGGLRVLILDDEEAIVELASLVIEEAGGHPLGVTDADAAERILAQADVDVVLVDLVMPGATGRGFLDRLSATGPSVPVVAMSGVPEQGANASHRPNVHATLDKPFSAAQLLAALRLAIAEGTR